MGDNTKPEFFEEWSKVHLREECARLNQVLQDCLHIIRDAGGSGAEKSEEVVGEDGGKIDQQEKQEEEQEGCDHCFIESDSEYDEGIRRCRWCGESEDR